LELLGCHGSYGMGSHTDKFNIAIDLPNWI
jgi:hypothetical protein